MPTNKVFQAHDMLDCGNQVARGRAAIEIYPALALPQRKDNLAAAVRVSLQF